MSVVRLRPHSSFGKLWTAALVSGLGDGVRVTALPLLAVHLTSSPGAIAGISIAAGVPWLVFTLLSGVIADRVDRRRLMTVVQTMRMAVSGALTAIVLLGSASILAIYVAAFLLATGEVFFVAAAPALLPRIVPPEDLSRANARLFGGDAVANEMLGPSLGGVLFTAASAAPFALDAVSFGVGAAFLRGIDGDFRATEPAHEAAQSLRGQVRRVGVEAAEGLAWVVKHRLMVALISATACANLSRAMTMAIFVLFAVHRLGVSGAGFGFLVSAVSIGAIAGALTVERLGRRLGDRRILLTGVLLHGLSTVAMGATTSAYAVAAFSVVLGFAIMMWNVAGVTTKQRLIPDQLMGRVLGVDRLVSWGVVPLGGLLGGVFATTLGLRAPFFVGGLAVLAAGAVLTAAVSSIAPVEAEPL